MSSKVNISRAKPLKLYIPKVVYPQKIMFCLPIYDNQYSLGIPNLGVASYMGSHLGKYETMGTSFLPTATAWDFSPPQLHQYCLGQQAPHGASSGEDEEKGKSPCWLFPSHCLFISHSTSAQKSPASLLPRVTIHMIHPPSLSLSHTQRSCDKNL